MVAVFLGAELDSDRFGLALAEELRRSGRDRSLLTSPDLYDAADSRLRRRPLDSTRECARREGMFGGFPDGVSWQRVALTADELLSVRYIDYSDWVQLSGGTRRPMDAAARVQAGLEVFGVPNDAFVELSRDFAAGADWPELIVVSASPEGGDVVLEGHVRLTAMALAPGAIPAETEVIRGVSPRMVD